MNRLARRLPPALAVGVGSALVLLLVDWIAEHWLHDLLWDANSSRWWIFLVLTLTGVAVGLVIWLVPGHAGPDPATVDLMHKPGPVLEVPGLLLAAILGLAGGVSLGPEFPVLGANAAVAVAIGRRIAPTVGAAAWGGLAMAGTIGALFGTPIAAALMLTEAFADAPSSGSPSSGSPSSGEVRESMWDRLFAPLAAAAAGSLTVAALSHGSTMTLSLPTYSAIEPADLVTGSAIASAAAVLGLAATWLFPLLYKAFHRLRHPLLILTAGGVALGLLGALGGPITMFKGLSQMKELTNNFATYSAASLAAIAGIKLLAMLIAATSGFRGGRIFPAVFVGVALGLLAHALFGGIPVAVAVSCGVMGLVLAVTRSGWMSIFVGAVLVANPLILVVLAIAVLPAWLLVTGRPTMIATARPAPAQAHA